MIKQLIKALASSDVDNFKITEIENNTNEAYYVLQKLETARETKVIEYQVTIFKEFKEGVTSFLGSSSFNVPYKLTSKQLSKKIEDALYSASFVKNKTYELPVGDGKKHNFKQKKITDNPYKLLDDVAKTFISVSKPNQKFNSLEVFYKEAIIRVVTSTGIDYKKNTYSLEVEAIPSYDGFKPEDHVNQKVELYKYFRYQNANLELIKKDAIQALDDVKARYEATKLPFSGNVDVIIRDEDIRSLCGSLIGNYSYSGVYNGSTNKKVGDEVQKGTGEKLSIGLDLLNSADRFDNDGVLLKPVEVIKDGILNSYFGDNRFAQYLGVKPTGNLKSLKVKAGKSSTEEILSGKYLEIISLSGIQIDIYSSYIGGEVRLANYHDGDKVIPVSGFSFSGNLFDALADIKISKEVTSKLGYSGPRFIRLPNLGVL
ncbi:MAG: metallopeptidase TldD-related protein [Bacilli bacterium]